jgi:hypothetical protein
MRLQTPTAHDDETAGKSESMTSADTRAMEIQLRDYRVRHGHMDEWIAGWEGGVVPLRQQEGFVIVGAWVDRQHDRFVWLVG